MHRGGFAIYERQIFTHVGSSGSKRPQSARRLCPTESHRGVDGYLMEELTAGFRRVATRRQAHTAQSPAALSSARRLVDDPELGRFHSGTGGQEPFRCQPPLEQLPHRRRPARHPPLESEIVKRRMPSRASAVRELLKRGLAAEGFLAAGAGVKSSQFGVIDKTPSGR